MTQQVPIHEPSAVERHLAASDTATPIDQAKVNSWSAPVRAALRRVLSHNITAGSSPALRSAVYEITDLIDQADKESNDA
ncbi:MAG TPA: hypothetical protein VFQ44_02345 [Streptosporangiaceae bacterium]|nr:hypothetical protein [Streptosporangiaceae bacterium]